MSTKDWQTLTRLTGGARIEVERVRLVDQGVAIEGPFDLPPLAQLSAGDQVFVAAFVQCHGSIKQMERYFGVSYPTIKNRLNKIAAQLPLMEVAAVPESERGGPEVGELLSRLERGELNAQDVLARLKPSTDKERS